jgi:uncharacterized protein YggE
VYPPRTVRAMDTSTSPRRPLRTAVGVLLAVLLVALAWPESERPSGPEFGITITASGSSTLTPDGVRLEIYVSARSGDVDSARDQMAAVASRVRQALLDEGVEVRDLATRSVAISPEYEYSSGRQELLGYRASQDFTVIVRDADRAGAILDAAVDAGGNNLQVLSTSPVVLDPAAAREEARENAIDAARRQAESYADLLDAELGRVEFITESASVPGPVYAAPSEARADAADTKVDLGQQEVTVSVTIRWSLR